MTTPEQYHSPEAENSESFEYWLDHKARDDYFRQVDIFQKIGLLDVFSKSYRSYERGVIGIDGQEYSLPEFEQIKAELIRNKEKYEAKFKQGFREIQLTPFALPLDVLIKTLEQRILVHYKEGKLLATKGSLEDPDESLKLGINQPIRVWEEWEGANISGKCVYYPKSFDKENHQGKTKQKILDEQKEKQSSFTGWNVILLEDNPNIPKKGKGKTIGKRKQIEANKTPEQYLKLLQNDPQYKDEQGLTNEDWLTQFLIHLERENQVINDYQGKGSTCYLLGSFSPAFCCVGRAFWDRGDRRASLTGCISRFQSFKYGLCSAVGLEKF